MSIAVGIAALVGVAAITPGPNNVAVMAAAAHRGFIGALPAIGAVVLGSLVMVAVALAGLGAILTAAPVAGLLLSIAGCAYLGYLGVRMFAAAPPIGARASRTRVVGQPVASAAEPVRPSAAAGVRSDFAGLFLFQFLNPKGWTMVLTAVAAAQAAEHSMTGAAWLVSIFLFVPAACLSLWALSGALLSRRLERPRFRRRFDQVMGVTLMICALVLLVEAGQGAAAVSGEIPR